MANCIIFLEQREQCLNGDDFLLFQYSKRTMVQLSIHCQHLLQPANLVLPSNEVLSPDTTVCAESEVQI